MSFFEKKNCLNRSCVSLGKVPLPLGQKPWNVCLRLLLWTPAYWQGYVRICTHEDFEFAMYCAITWVSATSYPLYLILILLWMQVLWICSYQLFLHPSVGHAAWCPWTFDGQFYKRERGSCGVIGQIRAQQTSTYWAVLWHAHRKDTGKIPSDVLQFFYNRSALILTVYIRT